MKKHVLGTIRRKTNMFSYLQVAHFYLFQLKSHFPNRPIVLIGWNIGALVASQVSTSSL